MIQQYSQRKCQGHSDEVSQSHTLQIHKSRVINLCIVCPVCCAQFHGEWQTFSFDNKRNLKKLNKCHSEIITTIEEEIVKFSNLNHCPICSGRISKKYIYLTGDYWYGLESELKLPNENILYNYTVSQCFKKIDESINSNSRKKAKSLAEDQIIKHNSDIIPNNTVGNQLRNDTLKEYILNLINLETNILSLTKRLEQLYYNKLCNNKAVIFEENYALYKLKQKSNSANDSLNNAKEQLSEIQTSKVSYKIAKYPSKPEYPILKTPNFFNKRKIQRENEQLLQKYQEELETYHAEVKKCDAINENNRINAENDKNKIVNELKNSIDKFSNKLLYIENELNQKTNNKDKTPNKALGEKYLLDPEIKTVEETLSNLFKCRNELYSYNIVFEKYRNIVALSTFYEYLMACRCETLDGVNGAYNIYENELRLNTIITKLDEIVVKLDEIKDNQYMIYNKLIDIDNSLATLNNTMAKAVSSLDTISKNTSDMNVYLDNISKNTAVIAHNSAVTAYYSKVNAELTNALGFMVALK